MHLKNLRFRMLQRDIFKSNRYDKLSYIQIPRGLGHRLKSEISSLQVLIKLQLITAKVSIRAGLSSCVNNAFLE